MKIKMLFILMILLIGGGCDTVGRKDISVMDSAELPNVVAFQDDFTREFMASTVEVEEGYYLFKSKTGGYTMLYPENAKMDEIYYEMPGEAFEAIQFGESKETNEFEYYVRAIYNSTLRARSAAELKDVLSSYIEYDGIYEIIEYKDKTIHFATTEYVARNGKGITYRFFAVIMSNDSNQAVSMRYNVMTDIDDSIDLDFIQDQVMNIMESIDFIANE